MIKEFLVDYFNKKGINPNIDEDLFEKGYIDSIGIFRLLLEIEVNFNKSISIDDLTKLTKVSINEISNLLDVK